MAEVATGFAGAFRDDAVPGSPDAGRHKPIKSEIRALGGTIESYVQSRISAAVAIEAADREDGDNALASLIGSTTGTIIFLQFDSRLAASLASIDGSVQQFRTAGWDAPGDFGGDHYFRVDEEPAHGRKVQSLDGAWWEGRGRQVFVEMFGAKGIFDRADALTHLHDDTPAINAALDYFRDHMTENRDGYPVRTKGALYCRPDADYQIFGTLNWSGFRAKFHIYGNNAQINAFGGVVGVPMVDALWSRGLHVRDLTFFAENGSTAGTGYQPSYGIVLGRKNGGDDASEHHFENVKFDGWFDGACMMSIATELTKWTKCTFINAVSGDFVGSIYSGFAIHLTSRNEASFTSEWQGDASGIEFSMNENKFDQCNISSAQSSAIRMRGTTAGTQFLNCYANCSADKPIAVLVGMHAGMVWDVHCEVSTVSIFWAPESMEGNVQLPNLQFRDHGLMVPAIFAREDTTTFDIRSGRMEVSQVPILEIAPKLAATGTAVNFHGQLYFAPDVVSLVNLDGVNSLRGELWTGCEAADVSNTPGSGYWAIYPYQGDPAYG